MQVAGFFLPGLMVIAFGVLVGLSAHTRLAGAGAAAAVTLPWWLMRFGVNPANVGLFQRASFAVLNVWLLVFAVVVWSRLTPAYEAMQTRELSHRTDC